MLQLSLGNLALLVTLLVVVVLAWDVLKNCFLSPLREIPGPLLAKLSHRWILFIDLAGKRTSTIHELHRKYGNAVRVGPNEVSLSNVESVNEIYSASTAYMKTPYYELATIKPVGIFGSTHKNFHSRRRRLLNPAFSQSHLYDSEPLIMAHVKKLFAKVQSRAGEPINVLALFRMLALDVGGDLFIGKPFGALDHDDPPQFIQDADRLFLMFALENAFPWLWKFFSRLPVPALQHFLGCERRLGEYGKAMFEDYIARYGRQSTRKDLLTKILSPTEDKDGTPPMTDLQTCSEIANLVFAGTDTTSTTLTYMCWELARNPVWQGRVLEELQSSIKRLKPQQQQEDKSHGERWQCDEKGTRLPTYRELVDLTVLDAVVNESLRLHPAAPASLTRVTPRGGRTLAGHYVPQGTTVSMQCYTTHRDPAAFPDPEDWNPDRWLSLPPDTTTTAAQPLFMPFSKGARGCLGKNIALMELKLVTAGLVLENVIKVASGLSDEDMEMRDHFLAFPKAGRCDLVFVARE